MRPAVLALLFVVGCSSGEPANRDDGDHGAGALCAALALAASGDDVGARAAFMDGAHDELHELASTVEERDRAAAAALLESKQRVEAAIVEGTGLAAPLEDLIQRTGDAVERLDRPRPADCQGSTP